MNYLRNTMKGEPALFFHYVPVAEWKGARFLHFIFYFCFSAEGGSNREDLPICHRQSRWQPYDFLPIVSAALELEGQPCLKPGKSIDSLPIPILFSLPPSRATYLMGPIYTRRFYSVNWDAPGTDLRLRNPFQSLCAEETVGQIQYSAMLI